jgi:MFS family permease
MKPKIRIDKMRSNLRKYYAFRILCTMNFIAPIFMLFLIDKGLSSFEIFLTQSAYMVIELMLVVPFGALADRIGRRKVLIFSAATYAIAFVVYGSADSFMDVLLAELVFAFSSASFQGTGDALIYDTLAEAKQHHRYKQVLGNIYAVQSIMVGASSVVGAWIAKNDLSLPFFVTAIPVSLAIVPLLLIKEPERQRCSDTYMNSIKVSARHVVSHKPLRNMMYYVAVSSFVGMMAWLLYQPLITNMGVKVQYLGIILMCFQVMSAIGSKVSHRLEQKLVRFDILGVIMSAKALLLLLVYYTSGAGLLVFAGLVELVSGFSDPIVSDLINRHTKSSNRATVLSMSTMSGCLSFAVFSPLFGMAVDAYSEQTAYLLLGIIAAAFVARQLLVLLWARRSA